MLYHFCGGGGGGGGGGDNKIHNNDNKIHCWFHGSSFKVFLLFFLFSDWLKSNHLNSRIEHGLLDIFSRHICSAVRETI